MLTRLQKTAGLAFVILVSCLGLVQYALGGGANPDPYVLEQPDRTRFWARSWGDEWLNGTETLEGYTILKDPISGRWSYAQKTSQGQLVPSQWAVGVHTPINLPLHLRPDSLAEFRDRWRNDSESSTPFRVAPPARGVHRLLAIVVDFTPSVSLGTTEMDWEQFFFSGSSSGLKSVRQYWSAPSYGALTLEPASESYGSPNNGIVFVTLPYPHPNPSSLDGSISRVFRDAIQAASAFVDFPAFDTNHDDYISTDELHVFLVLRGYEKSYGGIAATCSDRPSIWAHRATIRASEGAPMVGGGVIGDPIGAPAPGPKQGGFSVMGEWHCRAPNDVPGHMATIGVAAHELSHDLGTGAPDFYGSKSTIGSVSYGAGRWSLQAVGFWNGTEVSGHAGTHPALPDPWTRWQLGFLVPERVGANTNLLLQQIETANGPHHGVFLVPGKEAVEGGLTTPEDDEYFLIENRERDGAFDIGLPGDGLLIWHIRQTTPALRTDTGPERNAVVAGRQISLKLEPADSQSDLECDASPAGTAGCNPGDGSDPWKVGTATEFHYTLSPDRRDQYGMPSSISIIGISPSERWMSASVMIDPPLSSPSPIGSGSIPAGPASSSPRNDSSSSSTQSLGSRASDRIESVGGSLVASPSDPGTNNARDGNGIRYCDRFPGENAGERIRACIADLPLAGGIADARGFEGAQWIYQDPFAGVSKPVLLLLGAAVFTTSTTITIPANVVIQGLGNASVISYTGTAIAFRMGPPALAGVPLWSAIRDLRVITATAASAITISNSQEWEIARISTSGFNDADLLLEATDGQSNNDGRIVWNSFLSSAGDGVKAVGSGILRHLYISGNNVAEHSGKGLNFIACSQSIFIASNDFSHNAGGNVSLNCSEAFAFVANHMRVEASIPSYVSFQLDSIATGNGSSGEVTGNYCSNSSAAANATCFKFYGASGGAAAITIEANVISGWNVGIDPGTSRNVFIGANRFGPKVNNLDVAAPIGLGSVVQLRPQELGDQIDSVALTRGAQEIENKLFLDALRFKAGRSTVGTLTHAGTADRTWVLPDVSGIIALQESRTIAGDIAGSLATGYVVNDGAITDAKFASSGITTRSKLPPAIAYKDQSNLFAATDTSTAGSNSGQFPDDAIHPRWGWLDEYVWIINPSANQLSDSRQYATRAYAYVPAGNASEVRHIGGLDGLAETYGSGHVDDITASSFWALNATAPSVATVFGNETMAESDTGTVDWLGSSLFWAASYGGTVNNQASLWIRDNGSTGSTVLNRYGIRIEPFTGSATNDYGIYQAGAAQKNYFAGRFGIGIPDPGQALEVNGGVRLNTVTTKPPCDAASRGTFWITQGGAGRKDSVEICVKDATDILRWQTIF